MKRNYRLVTVFVLFALVFAQISVSIHSVTHPDHVVSVASNHIDFNKNQNNDSPQNKDKCPICLLAQILKNGLSPSNPIDFVASLPAKNITQNTVTTPQTVRFRLYASRGPPTFLI